MPNWGQVLNEIQGMRVENPLDTIRRKYLAIMHDYITTYTKIKFTPLCPVLEDIKIEET